MRENQCPFKCPAVHHDLVSESRATISGRTTKASQHIMVVRVLATVETSSHLPRKVEET